MGKATGELSSCTVQHEPLLPPALPPPGSFQDALPLPAPPPVSSQRGRWGVQGGGLSSSLCLGHISGHGPQLVCFGSAGQGGGWARTGIPEKQSREHPWSQVMDLGAQPHGVTAHFQAGAVGRLAVRLVRGLCPPGGPWVAGGRSPASQSASIAVVRPGEEGQGRVAG